MMRTLPPAATPTSKSARNDDYGSDSSSTFGVRTVGLQPLTQERCSNATQSPPVCVDRQRHKAWQLARSIASLSLTAVLQSVVAT